MPETAAAQMCELPRPIQVWMDRALLGGLCLWMFLACCFPMMDTDFWWHLRTGELILVRGELPDLDWYTFTDHDKPWIDLHWGFQLFVAAVWHLGGANLTVLVKAAVYTAAIAIGLHAAGRSLPAMSRVAFWLLPAFCISGRAYERPEMLSLVALITWLWILDRADERPRLLWFLPLLQLVWTNCHALSVLGLVAFACYAADWIARSAIAPRASTRAATSTPPPYEGGGRGGGTAFGLAPVPPSVNWSTLLIVGALLFATAFLNPWFDEGAFFPFVLYRKFSVDQAFYSANIGEFQRPVDFFLKHGLTNLYLFAQVWLWGLAALSFVLLLARGRWNVFRLLMFAGFSSLAWAASRNSSLFAIVAGYVLCANARDVWPSKSNEQSIPATPLSRPWIYRCVIALLLATVVGLVVGGAFLRPIVRTVLYQGTPVNVRGPVHQIISWFIDRWILDRLDLWPKVTGEYKPFGLGEREAWFAHEAAKFAGQQGLPEHAIVYHNGQAAVYIYHNAPRCRVFMDARLEVSTQRTFERYLEIQRRIARGDPSWTVSIRDSQGRLPVLILDSRQSRFEISALLNTPMWRLVYADPAAAVFIEKSLAEKLKLNEVSFQPLLKPPN